MIDGFIRTSATDRTCREVENISNRADGSVVVTRRSRLVGEPVPWSSYMLNNLDGGCASLREPPTAATLGADDGSDYDLGLGLEDQGLLPITSRAS